MQVCKTNIPCKYLDFHCDNKMFTIICNNDKIWNQLELIDYLVQNQDKKILLDINPEAICLQSLGVYELLDVFNFEHVIIRTWNPLEAHSKYEIKLIGDNFCFKKIPNIPVQLHQWDQTKIFFCLYGRPAAGRLALAGHLFNRYKQQSLIHFSTNIDEYKFEFDKLLAYDVASMPAACDLLQHLPLLQASNDQYSPNEYNFGDTLTELYQHILVDVVGETFVQGTTFFPSEKTTRPMLLKKPFMIFASRDHLAYLRQMGFRTFHDFWDEDYDGFETRDRLLRMYQVIQKIAVQPQDQLLDMYHRMQPVLEHNYNLLMSQSFNKKITKIQ
jgi:hypothetical protein